MAVWDPPEMWPQGCWPPGTHGHCDQPLGSPWGAASLQSSVHTSPLPCAATFTC